MIVTNRPPRLKRPRKPAQAVEIAAPRIVQHTPKGRAWAPNPDVKITPSVVAFFERMGLKLPPEE
jgi:hypothetical protein